MKATRRQGREWALMLLVQFDLNPPANDAEVTQAIADFWEQQKSYERERLEADELRTRECVFSPKRAAEIDALASVRKFAEDHVKGVWAKLRELDEALMPFLENWSLPRLGTVERNVLRLGAWEILDCPDIPNPIALNEAVDLTKFFASSKSGRFVNGVLDKFSKTQDEKTFVP